jgi:D-alanyl-D-alanine carboxypeptidase
MMNDKAQQLGCTHTHFANPNGLDTDGHYTCARDMAIITRAANEYPEFAEYSGQTTYTLPADNVIGDGWTIQTKVDMLRSDKEDYDARIYAAKTGYTTLAHNTFVACGKTDSSNLIVSVLNCPVKHGTFVDAKALLDYGAQFSTVTVSPDLYSAVAEQAADTRGCTVDTDSLPSVSVLLPADLSAADLAFTPVTQDDDSTAIAVTVSDDSRAAYAAATGKAGTQTLASIPLTLLQKPSVMERMLGGTAQAAGDSDESSQRVSSAPLQTIAILVIAAVVLVVLVLLRRTIAVSRKRRHKRRKARR